jgi:hypothetical protein
VLLPVAQKYEKAATSLVPAIAGTLGTLTSTVIAEFRPQGNPQNIFLLLLFLLVDNTQFSLYLGLEEFLIEIGIDHVKVLKLLADADIVTLDTLSDCTEEELATIPGLSLGARKIIIKAR